MSEILACEGHPIDDGSFKRAVLRVIPVIRYSQEEAGPAYYFPVPVDSLDDQAEAQNIAMSCARTIMAGDCQKFIYQQHDAFSFEISTRPQQHEPPKEKNS